MGGKKGGPVLNSWIKEFCTLVFIQTIQAFIYAIIISIIVKMSFLSIEDVDDRNASMGIICVVALTSVFKVEELVKKIFGIGNSKADVRGAMSSLAKTAIAWNFGKKVLDNTSKVAGGVKARQDAAKGRQKLKSRMERDQATFGVGGASTTEMFDDSSQEALNQGQSSPGGVGGRTETTHSGGQSAGNAGNRAPSANNAAKNGKNIRDYNAMMDKYQDQLDELKKKRQEGTKQILRGIGETAGAVPGALAGTIIGGADGDLDSALRGAAVGMGIGDTVGGAVAENAYKYGSIAAGAPSKVASSVDTVKKIQKAVAEQNIDGKGLTKAKNLATAYYRQATKNRVTEKELQAMIKKANEANADNAN